MASSAEAMPPCAADQATGFSRNRRTSDSAASEKIGPVLAGVQHVPPGAQAVQGDIHVCQRFEGAGKHAVEEHHEGVVDDRAGITQRVGKADLRLAVRRQVLHQQRALADRHIALDQRVLAETFRLLAHIGHRRMHPVGDPGGERNTGGLAAGHRLDRLVADMALDLLHRQVANLRAGLREIDDPAAVDIDRGFPAGGEGIGFLRTEIYRLDLQQDARGGQGSVTIPLGGAMMWSVRAWPWARSFVPD